MYTFKHYTSLLMFKQLFFLNCNYLIYETYLNYSDVLINLVITTIFSLILLSSSDSWVDLPQ